MTLSAEPAAAGTRPAAGAPRRATGRAGFLQVVRVIWTREVLIYFRDRPRMISSFTMPVIMLVMFGEGLGNSIAQLPGDIGYRQFIFPGMVAMIVLMNSVFSGVSIVTDRQFGFLRESFAYALRPMVSVMGVRPCSTAFSLQCTSNSGIGIRTGQTSVQAPHRLDA